MTTSVPQAITMDATREVDLASAYLHCRDVTRRSASSFAAAFWLLPPERRRAVHAVYAFCRLADDIADDTALKGDRHQLLELWRAELEATFRGASTHPVGIALGDTIQRFDLPRGIFEELLLGIESDLLEEEIETFDDLRTYCYRVASTVGLLVVRLLGCRSPQALEYAETLGIAVQITNILRDVAEDAASGRIYLPREDLRRFGIKEAELAGPVPGSRLRMVMAFYAEQARILYERAEALLPDENRRDLRPAVAMGRIYAKLLDELHRQGFANKTAPGVAIRLSHAHRLRIAAGVWFGVGKP